MFNRTYRNLVVLIPEFSACSPAGNLYTTQRLRVFALLLGCVLASLTLLPSRSVAAEALVAVATNFSEVAEQLAENFSAQSDHQVRIAAGSTGMLYAQIRNGAPYDIFLAADQYRPESLEQDGIAVSDSRFTYAAGKLVLWQPGERVVANQDGIAVLRAGRYKRLAVANPELAPYGLAAREALISLGLWDPLQPKIVRGQNVGQAYTMVATGNADIGLVALSSVLRLRSADEGNYWEIPEELHTPIYQDAVLLGRGAGNLAAREFLEYLGSDKARKLISSFGYGFP